MKAAKLNPKHLALWSIAGAVLAASPFFTTLLAGAGGDRVRLVLLLAPGAAGAAVWVWADRRLKRRFRDGVWSEEELAPTRAMLAHPAMHWATAALFFAALLTAMFSKHHAAFIYITTLPMNAVSGMRAALAPPKPRTGGLIDWKSFKPIQSDHWGEPVRHGGDAPLPL